MVSNASAEGGRGSPSTLSKQLSIFTPHYIEGCSSLLRWDELTGRMAYMTHHSSYLLMPGIVLDPKVSSSFIVLCRCRHNKKHENGSMRKLWGNKITIKRKIEGEWVCNPTLGSFVFDPIVVAALLANNHHIWKASLLQILYFPYHTNDIFNESTPKNSLLQFPKYSPA